MTAALQGLRSVKLAVADAKKTLGDNVMFKKISVQELAKAGGRMSVLKDRNHKFDHNSIFTWINGTTPFLQGILVQWMEDAGLLQEMVTKFTSGTPAAELLLPTIMDLDKHGLRAALLANKNYKPCRNGIALLSRWRSHIRALWQNAPLMPGGIENTIRSVGLAVNTCTDWCDLVEMIHEITALNGERNTFARKNLAVKFKNKWKQDQMGDSIKAAVDKLIGGEALILVPPKDDQAHVYISINN